jgi:pantetheine-phosphate adenylyltransferase
MKVALFPGSFDPITIGHEDLIKRAVPLFDIIIVAIGINSSKKYQYSIEQRIEFLKLTFSKHPTIEITPYEGLTIDFCQSVGAQYILRGIRNSSDYLYENSIAQMNKAMDKDIETIFFPTTPALSAINSTIVRDIINNNGDASQFVPQVLRDKI